MTVDDALLEAWQEVGFPPGRGVLVGVSGGPDSTALLFAFARLRDQLGLKRLWVGFFDHGWRSVDDDRALVEALVRELGLPATFGYAGSPALGEERARAKRRAFLLAVKETAGLDLIALAHSADDQAETVLMQLLRGTVRGKAGMAVWQEPFFRPWLALRRRAIHESLQGRQVVSDPSNRDPRYLRTRIRAFLAEEARRGRDPVPAILRHADLARREEAFWQAWLEGTPIFVPVKGGLVLEEEPFRRLPPPAQGRLLLRVFQELGWEASVERIERLAAEILAGRTPSGLPRRHVAIRHRGRLYLGVRPSTHPVVALRVAAPGRYLLPRPAPASLWGWQSPLPELPLDLRYYDHGPLSWRGHRLEASDLPAPPWERLAVPLLAKGGVCRWIAGLGCHGGSHQASVRIDPGQGTFLVVEEDPMLE